MNGQVRTNATSHGKTSLTSSKVDSLKVVSPEDKERLVNRARKLSGTVNPITEQEGYKLRNKFKTPTKASPNIKQLSKSVTPKTSKRAKHKLELATEGCQDIRVFSKSECIVEKALFNNGQHSNLANDLGIGVLPMNINSPPADESFYSTCERVISDTEISFKSAAFGTESENLDTTLEPSCSADHDINMSTEEVSNASILKKIGEMQQDMKKQLTTIQQDFKTSIDSMHEKLGNIDLKSQATDQKVEAIDLLTSNNSDLIAKLQQKIEFLMNENDVMKGTMSRQYAIIQELQEKTETLEQARVKNNLIFYNIDDSKSERAISTLLDFFKNTLRPAELIYVQDAYRQGAFKEGRNRPLVAVLKQPSEKSKVYQNWKNLKQARNSRGEKYRFREHRPARATENDKRINDIKYHNRKKTSSTENQINS